MAGFTPALRSGCTAFKGAAVSAQTSGRMSGPVMADAWVRVVPGDTVGVGQQADRLVAGAGVVCSLVAALLVDREELMAGLYAFVLLLSTEVLE